MNTAVQLYQGGLSLITTPMPSVNDPNDVLVQIKYCGVCGTDLHIIKGEFPAAEKLILGHEFAGVVAAKGDSVMHVKVGDRYSKCYQFLFSIRAYFCRLSVINNSGM